MVMYETELADSIHVSPQYIKELTVDQNSITPSIALRLAKYFGMSLDFWMNLQLRWDLYHAQRAEQHELAVIQPYPMPTKAAG